jgi:DNA-binding transcriptional ArsR family regulator
MPKPHPPSTDTLFRVLADPTRRGIVEHLCNGPLRAGQLADELGMSPPAMSRHLKLLMETGIVTDRRGDSDARARVFALQPASLGALQAWLDEIKAHWDKQLAAFARHVERRKKR